MAIADLVSGTVSEPLGVRELAGDRSVEPGDVLALAERHGARMVDLKFTDLPGTWQHMGMALASARRGGALRRHRLRRLLDPRLPGDLRVRHAAAAGSVHGRPGSVLRGVDDLARVHGARPDHARALHARPALRGDQGGAAPARERCGGRRLLRARGGVLRLRPRRVRPAGQHRVLRGRLRGGPLDLGPGFPAARRRAGRARLHEPLAGGLLPRAAERHPQRPARHDGDRARGARHPDREPSPRGRRARGRARSTCASSRCWRWPTRCSCTSTSSRTRPSRRASRRRSCPSRSSRRTAPACTSTSRSGRAARR